MTHVTIDLTEGRERLRVVTDPCYKYVLNNIMTRKRLSESHAFAFLVSTTLMKSKITSKIDKKILIEAIQEQMSLEGYDMPISDYQMDRIMAKARKEVKDHAVS